MNEDCTPYRFSVFSDVTLMDCMREFGDREYPVKFVPYEETYYVYPHEETYYVYPPMAEEKYIYSYAAAKYQHLVKL